MKGKRLVVMALVLLIMVGIGAQGQKDPGVAKEVELRWASIWVGNDSKAPAVEALVAEYNAKNEGRIKVVIEPQPDYNAYEQKVRTSLAGQVPADIFTIKLNPTTATFYQSNLLMDFNKVMDSAWKATFDAPRWPNPRSTGSPIPSDGNGDPALWYNMDLLKKVG